MISDLSYFLLYCGSQDKYRISPMFSFTRQKLTKKLLLGLPRGAYLVSNCYKEEGEKMVPCFQEVISDPDEREAQWQRIRNARADGRLCFIYPSKKAYEQYFARLQRDRF